jgi:hypothetical protein
MNSLPGLALNRDLPDVCLLSSLVYRCEPLVHQQQLINLIARIQSEVYLTPKLIFFLLNYVLLGKILLVPNQD